jgi:multidrug efflux pump subunit AcrB
MGVDDAENMDSLTAEVRQLAEEHFGAENVTVTGGALTSSAFGSFGLVTSGDMQKLIEFNDQALETLESVDGLTNITSNLTERTHLTSRQAISRTLLGRLKPRIAG